LKEHVWWKRPELRRSHNWLLHHNHAPAHASWKPQSLWLTATWLLFPILPTLWA
jgi:hypothetical protein